MTMDAEKIKENRKRLKLTQEELGKLLGVSKRTVINYEKGEFIPESTVKLLHIILDPEAKESNAPKQKNVPKSNAELINIDDETEVFINKNGIKFFEYPDGTTKIEVLKIPFNAYASYLEVFNDEEKLMNEFSTTTFSVDKVAKGNYVAFCIKNNSMNGGGIDDTPDGAEVLAREIGRHLWKSGFHNNKYGFILMTTEAIYHKDIKTYNDETGMLLLSSRNPSEDDFEISINNVYRIFNVIKRTF